MNLVEVFFLVWAVVATLAAIGWYRKAHYWRDAYLAARQSNIILPLLVAIPAALVLWLKFKQDKIE